MCRSFGPGCRQTGFADNLQFEKSLELFKLMNEHGMRMDQFSLVAMFSVCASREDFQSGVTLHCQALKLGLDNTAFVGNVILTMYSKWSSISEAEKVFRLIKERDVISCNTFIAACSHCGHHVKALSIFRDMEKVFGIAPDDFTLASTLTACAGLASIHHGSQIHARLIRNKSDLDFIVCNALVNMYAKCGCIEYAEALFLHMSNKNLVSWNTMISGFGNHGHGKRAVEMFEEMGAIGILPDSCTFTGLLVACNHAGMVEEGKAYFDSMELDYNITPGIEHLSCLIDLLGRAGRLEEAEVYLRASCFKDDSVIWGSLLSSCRLHGDIIVGERAARKLMELGPETSSPFVLLSNLYALDERWGAVAEMRKMLKGCGVKKVPGHSLIQVEGIVEKFMVGDISHVRIDEIRQTLINLNLTARKLYVRT
uniref:Pentatricopeptide repeat-containing protein At5g04780 n=1 Tax=Anthurium amnicola TaxID=1678845 RepID=A0A1D1YBS7_9ARAE